MIEQLDHANLVVGNLARAKAFYRDLLGLRLTKEVRIEGEWIDRVVGLKGVRATVVYLEATRGPRLELIRYHVPIGRRPRGLGCPNTKGLRHLAFRVRNLNLLVRRLRRAGVRFLSAVQQVPATQVRYAGGARKRLVYFRDPEGNLLELCEYRP